VPIRRDGKKRMKFAIIGTSRIAELFAEAVAMCSDVEIAVVYSRTKDNAERFARAFFVPETTTSLEELARNPAIDAVYVASPNSCHYGQSVMMLQNGKHVLCEKPISTSADEFSKMLRVAQENGVVLLEASKHLHAPGIGILRKLIPEIGAVRRASFVFNQYSSRYDRLIKFGEVHNVFSKEMGGGALMDIGVYCIELMVALFGKPELILCSSIMLPSGVDSHGAVIARYDGFLVELGYSKIVQSAVPSVIEGESGSLVFETLSRMKRVDVVMRNGEGKHVACNCPDNQMVYEIQAFKEMLSDPQMAVPFQDISMTSQILMDEIKSNGAIKR